jgi:multidrug resistance efflux pump
MVRELGWAIALGSAGFGSAGPEMVAAWTGDVRATLSLEGTLVPADAAPQSLWLEAYRGELLVLEVADHGAHVNAGDLLLRLDSTGIEERIRQSAFDLEQARQRLESMNAKHQIDAEASAEELARAQRELDWSRRALEAYLQKEKPFKLEQIRLQEQGSQHGLEDQRDELEQLEKMYREDELVDATEEIVLKRSRRQLASSLAWASLQSQQRAHDLAHAEAIKQERLEQEVAQKEAAFDRQQRSALLQRAAAAAEAERAAFDLEKQSVELDKLRRDQERLLVRAPRAGMVLHGALDAGAGAAILKRGSRAALYDVLLSVVDPDRLAVSARVPERLILSARSGRAVEVAVGAVPDFAATGRIETEALPSARDGNENIHRARVTFEKRDPRLGPGMRCALTVVVEEARGAVLIPLAAVEQRGGERLVRWARRTGEAAVERVVVLGPDDGTNVAVKEGVRAGELVQVGGQP